jgi:hypothetical protein
MKITKLKPYSYYWGVAFLFMEVSQQLFVILLPNTEAF